MKKKQLKAEFKKEYGVSAKTYDVLRKIGVIDNSEWHHTSKMFNKTHFSSWYDMEKERLKNLLATAAQHFSGTILMVVCGTCLSNPNILTKYDLKIIEILLSLHYEMFRCK